MGGAMSMTLNGSGSISGLVAGGLPDGTITTPDLADNTITNAKLAFDGGAFGFRNKIINGGCLISQRGPVAYNVSGVLVYGGADRIFCLAGGFSTIVSTLAQVSGVSTITGFAQSLTSVTATGSGYVAYGQRIEAANVRDLNGKTITFKCKVYQDTGVPVTVSFSVNKPIVLDTFSSTNNIGIFGLTSVPSGTWTYVTGSITLSASDASNGLEIITTFNSIGAITNKNFYISEVQLEAGSVATPFEARPYGTELALCQRYLPVLENQHGVLVGHCFSTTGAVLYCTFPVTARVAPTGITCANILSWSVRSGAGGAVQLSTLTFGTASKDHAQLACTVASGLIAGDGTSSYNNGGAGYLYFTGCEL